jgi:hypothetical protein
MSNIIKCKRVTSVRQNELPLRLDKEESLQSSVVKNDCVRISTVSEWKKITKKIEQCCILCISIPRTTAKVYEKSEYNKIDETYQLLIKENMIFFEFCSIRWRKSSTISSFTGGLPTILPFSILLVATNLSTILLTCGIKFASACYHLEIFRKILPCKRLLE